MEKVMLHSRPLADICFRGWDPINKTWRYGNLKKYFHINKGLNIWITTTFGMGAEEQFLVSQNSIGQWTGLYDVQGTPIYEGDLIQPTDRYREYLFKTYGQDTWTWTDPLEIYFKDGIFKTDAGILSEFKHGRILKDGLLEALVTGTAFEKELEDGEK